MEPNFAILFVTALIPLVLRELWYHEKVLGPALSNAGGNLDSSPRKMNKILGYVLTYVLGLLISFSLYGVVIHQSGMMSLLIGMPEFQDQTSEVYQYYANFMETYGDLHRTFGHGALHGVLNGLFLVTPVIAILAYTEKKGWKYVAVHAGFWIVCFLLMGGIIGALV